MNTERRYLFKKSDSYLFSFTVAHTMTLAGRGWNVVYDRHPESRDYDVFHVRNETVVNDREAVLAQVESVIGRSDFRSAGDASGTTGKMLVRTRDGVLIEGRYDGVNRLPELGQRRLLTETKLEPLEVKLAYWLRFDTTNAKYRWLAQTPCIGFGRGSIEVKKGSAVDQDGFPESLTFDTQLDVYALS